VGVELSLSENNYRCQKQDAASIPPRCKRFAGRTLRQQRGAAHFRAATVNLGDMVHFELRPGAPGSDFGLSTSVFGLGT